MMIRFVRGSDNELKLTYVLEELITAEKIRAMYAKGITFGVKGSVMGVLGHEKSSPTLIGEQLTARSRIVPRMLMSGNLFSRSDVGTTKKLMLNRIWGTYMANNDMTGAQTFLNDLFSRSKMSWMDKNKTRVSLEYETVEEALAIASVS